MSLFKTSAFSTPMGKRPALMEHGHVGIIRVMQVTLLRMAKHGERLHDYPRSAVLKDSARIDAGL